MKIAQVAPLFESVPPKAYGGTERVVSYLTEALVEMGHDVTLYASGDSQTTAQLIPITARSLRTDRRRPDWLVWHTLLLDRVFEDAERYDVIHFHVDFLHYPLARRCRVPHVTTLHGRLDLPDLNAMYRHFQATPLVSISHNQRKPLPFANWRATVHHGLPADLHRFHARPEGDYFAFLGRISPEKRVDRAIEIAMACGVPLRIAAKVDAADRDYFISRIQPQLDHPLIEYIGEIEERDKSDFLGNARAMLFPIDWPEPFGIVMIEAFACGTPVISYPGGSVGEVMQHGVTGFVVSDLQEAIEAAQEVHRIDRGRCREVFEQRFTSRIMAERYVDVYRELQGEERR